MSHVERPAHLREHFGHTRAGRARECGVDWPPVDKLHDKVWRTVIGAVGDDPDDPGHT